MPIHKEQLRQIRILVQEMGWGLFMRDVAGILAEQSNYTDNRESPEQSTNLAGCSRTISALNEFFEKCGKFTYPPELLKDN